MLSGIRQSLSSLAVCALLVFGLFSSWTPAVYAFTNLVWSDEFTGTTIDTTKWGFDLGNVSTISGAGWGNGELETYSQAAKNAFVSNGVLHIVALNDVGGSAPYSSARMRTLGKFSMTFGRLEVRARLPRGSPYWWPAIWMLATNYSGTTGVTNSWPECGEIDMVESKGSTPTINLATLHKDQAGDQGHDHAQGGSLTFASGDANTNFHNYVMQWGSGFFKFTVDSNTVQYTPNNGSISGWTSSIGAPPAPFNHPFYIIMNLAVGGQFVGSPSVATINAATTFPGDMQVDYIRVYQDLGTQAPLLGITSVSPTNACSNGGTVITITGTNFVGGATVTIGGVSAGFVTYVNTNTLTVVAPASSVGAKNVVVTNPDATSSTLANALNYLSAPASFAGLSSAVPAVSGATLTWSTAQGVSPFTYRVYQATSSGGENFASPVLTTSNLSGFVSLSVGSVCTNTYFFVVRAVDNCGNSDGNAVEQSVQPTPTPLVFGGLTNASATVGGASLRWAAAQGAIAPVTYAIYASTSSNIGSLTNLIAQTGNLSNSISLDPGNNCTNQYFLLVRAVDNCNRVDTNQIILSVQPIGASPVFSGLASITAAVNAATLNWAAGSGTPPITYNVFQATASGAENFAAPLLSTSSLFTSVPLYPGSNSPIAYYFVVRAQSGCNISESNTVEQSIRPLLDPTGNQNGDGISNGWKQQYGLDPFNPTVAGADPDGDGMSNLKEYLTGTDPTNSASYLHILSIVPQGNDTLITWMTAGGLTNAVESAPDPGGSYSKISGNVIITGSGLTTTNYLDSGTVTNAPVQFYRIRLIP